MSDQRLLPSAVWTSAFWSGALCGVAAIWIAEELRRRRSVPRLWLVHDASRDPGSARAIPLKRDAGAGDPAWLTPPRAGSPHPFERPGGAPGGSTAPEMQETPDRPEQFMGHHDPAEPVQSAMRTHVEPPDEDTNRS